MPTVRLAFDISVAGSETRTITREVEAPSIESAIAAIHQQAVTIKIRSVAIVNDPAPPPLDPAEKWVPVVPPPPNPDEIPPPPPPEDPVKI